MIDPLEPLLEGGMARDPLTQFERWFAQAAAVMPDPEAVALATADTEGRPSVRMVLAKAWDASGFVIYTNYASRKGAELEANPHAALLFHWTQLGRQVRIEGPTERVSDDESDAYFATRHRGSQLGAVASRQSQPIPSRSEMDELVAAATAKYEGRTVPRPTGWGGIRVVPDRFEFWQYRDDRLHDRLVYLPGLGAGGWSIERLQP